MHLLNSVPRVLHWTSRIVFALLPLASTAAAAELDLGRIAQAAGTDAKRQPDGVVRITWSRTDVPVDIDGVRLPPAAGLGSWAAFSATEHGSMVMGDTVVFQDEVDAAMDAAFAHGLDVTGLHNHFFFDKPKAYFMHIGAKGDPIALATGVKSVWDAIREVRKQRPMPAGRFEGSALARGSLGAKAISATIGHSAEIAGGIAKVTIGRQAQMDGHTIGASMGLTTWAAFSGADESAAVDGDIIMSAAEVQPVLRALRKAGLHVVALHNHMIGETPPLYFVHFWGRGPAIRLASGFRSVLDAQKQVTGEDLQSGAQAFTTKPAEGAE